MGEKFKIYCPICGKMLCVIDDNSTVEVECKRGCNIYRVTTKKRDISIKEVKKKDQEDHSAPQPIRC